MGNSRSFVRKLKGGHVNYAVKMETAKRKVQHQLILERVKNDVIFAKKVIDTTIDIPEDIRISAAHSISSSINNP